MSRKVDLYFFRHGETDWNAARRMQGHTDIPLNEKGRGQAKVLGKALSQLSIQTIFCSDLGRAIETANIVNLAQKSPMLKTPQLRELALGDCEGKFVADLQQTLGQDQWMQWVSTDPKHNHFRFPNGESKEELFLRCSGYIAAQLQIMPHLQAAAVSTHGGVIWQFLARTDTGSLDLTKRLPNCVAFHFCFDVSTQSWEFIKPLHLPEID